MRQPWRHEAIESTLKQDGNTERLVELDGFHVLVQSTPFHCPGSEPNNLLCDDLEQNRAKASSPRCASH
ncbi:unnamed protein product [Sphagnum balticum]